MNEWLPALLGGPVLLALWQRRRPSERAVHDHLRGRFAAQSVEPVTDAGRAPVFAVARALELDRSEVGGLRPGRGEPRGAHALIRPLGLEVVELVRGDRQRPRRSPMRLGRTELAGTRHGRKVVIRLDDETSTIHVDGHLPQFELRADASGWVDLDDAPPVVASWLGGLAPTSRWHGVVVQSGDDGLALRRPDESTRSWMHDLWLAEHLADAAACVVPTDRGARPARRRMAGAPTRSAGAGPAERTATGLVAGRTVTPIV